MGVPAPAVFSIGFDKCFMRQFQIRAAVSFLVLVPLLGVDEDRLPLKGSRQPSSEDSQAAMSEPLKRKAQGRFHALIRFAGPPGPQQLVALRERGIIPLQAVPSEGLVVSTPDAADLGGLGIRWVGRFQRENKISSLIVRESWVVPDNGGDREAGVFVVEAYPDVPRPLLRSLALEEGLEIVEREDLLTNHVLVRGWAERLRSLAEWDEIAYIFPASTELWLGRRVWACPGAVTAQGPVGQYVATYGEGWDGPGLGGAILGYFFERLAARIPEDGAREQFLLAAEEWARYAQLSYYPAGAAAAARTLNVLFAAGDHGDGYPFDGPSRTLAHTFYPSPPNPEPVAGDIHFDDAEEWVIGPDISVRSVDLFSVALHEVGHALGLGHSDVPGAVMYPYYHRATGLAADDVAAIRSLYAAAAGAPEALELRIDSPASFPATTTSASINVAGAVTGGSGDVQVEWFSDRGPAGLAAGGRSWLIPSLPLQLGDNVVTITARDQQPRETSRTVLITRREEERPVELQITSPTRSATYTASSATVTLAGTASHTSGIARVEWSNSRGSSGLASGTTTWRAGPIALQTGSNEIRVTAYAASGATASRTLLVTYQAPADTVAPALRITKPSSTNVRTSASSIIVKGTASDNVGVVEISWTTSTGGAGVAAGTTTWSATVPLVKGTNTVVVRAKDAAGNVGWRSLTVTRK